MAPRNCQSRRLTSGAVDNVQICIATSSFYGEMPSIMDKTRGVTRKKTYSKPTVHVTSKDPRPELLATITVTHINSNPERPSEYANRPDYERRPQCRRRKSPPPVRHTAKSLQQKQFINSKTNPGLNDRSTACFRMPPPKKPLSALDPLVASPSGPPPSLASSRTSSAKSSVYLPRSVRSRGDAPTNPSKPPPAKQNQPPKRANEPPTKRSYQTPPRATLQIPLIQSEQKPGKVKQISPTKTTPPRSEQTPKLRRAKVETPVVTGYLRSRVERDDAEIFRKLVASEKRQSEAKRLPVLHPRPWR